MKIVVIGGTGNLGSKIVTELRERGHEAVAAAPNTGVNTLTGEGLAEVLVGASAVIDVSNSPSFEEVAVMQFFTTSTKNLLEREAAAGVKHHILLSVVGTERMSDSAYIRAKRAQEKLVEESKIPYTIVHSTQFFEFIKAIAAAATEGDTVRVAPVLIQPVATTDVAKFVGKIADGSPINGVVEIAGPEEYRLDELVQTGLSLNRDPRKVISDPQARYFGALLGERTLVPSDGAQLGETSFQEWLR
jgi:uncharacterized protein YbjT (DUF2867 family)